MPVIWWNLSNEANGNVIIFEAKYAHSVADMDANCEKALQQIQDRNYAADYADDYDHILCYGISFFKKRCLIKMER